MDNDGCFPIAGLLLIGFFLGLLVATKILVPSVIELRQEAIEANVAEWQVDPKTGEREFVWVGAEVAGKDGG